MLLMIGHGKSIIPRSIEESHPNPIPIPISIPFSTVTKSPQTRTRQAESDSNHSNKYYLRLFVLPHTSLEFKLPQTAEEKHKKIIHLHQWYRRAATRNSSKLCHVDAPEDTRLTHLARRLWMFRLIDQPTDPCRREMKAKKRWRQTRKHGRMELLKHGSRNNKSEGKRMESGAWFLASPLSVRSQQQQQQQEQHPRGRGDGDSERARFKHAFRGDW